MMLMIGHCLSYTARYTTLRTREENNQLSYPFITNVINSLQISHEIKSGKKIGHYHVQTLKKNIFYACSIIKMPSSLIG